MTARRCVVCDLRPATGFMLCRQCQRSYDGDGGGDGSVAAAIRWASQRARRFAQKALKIRRTR